jgi:hypothetical protein
MRMRIATSAMNATPPTVPPAMMPIGGEGESVVVRFAMLDEGFGGMVVEGGKVDDVVGET